MQIRLLTCAFVALLFSALPALASERSTGEPDEKELLEGKAFILSLKPQQQDGGGYKFVY